MNPREQLLAVLRGEIPDCVPAYPDISNMITARLIGKPFWDIHVYQDPPRRTAHAGGGFILSTGDQTPRDTPFEIIFAVVETARTYGKY